MTIYDRIQRIRFIQRQLLRADDLNDISAYEAAMQALHVTGIHNTWGVATGLGITRMNDNVRVRIGEGAAYDKYGYAVLLPEAQTIAVPEPDAPANRYVWYDLCLRRPSDVARDPCSGEIKTEQALIRWHLAGVTETLADEPRLAQSVRSGEEIPIARVAYVPLPPERGGGRQLAIDYGTRRSARGLVRPKIVTSAVTRSTSYDPQKAAWTIDIDTSAAGFTTTPHYDARLMNHPVYDAAQNDSGLLEQMRDVIGPFISLRDATAIGFTLDVRFATAGTDATRAITVDDSLTFQVQWTAIEALDGSTLQSLFLTPVTIINMPLLLLDVVMPPIINE